jgi:hypothetical protein
MKTPVHTQEVARDTFPIFEVDPAPGEVGPIAVDFRGTGFLIAANLMMTCWHCVEAPVAEGNSLAAVALNEEGRLRALPLNTMGQDLEGADLATARIDASPQAGFELSRDTPSFGTDVWTFGYPLTERPTAERSSFRVNARYLKGYIMRDFEYERPGRKVLSYELDMRAPAGLSGAPLVVLGTRRLVGVVYGRHEAETIDRFSSFDPDTGVRLPEIQQLESFALAHHITTVLAHRSVATGGIEIAKLLLGP